TSRRSKNWPAGEQGLESVLDDGFPVAAGNRQHALKVFTPMPARQRLQSAQRIRSDDDWPCRIQGNAGDSGFTDKCRSGAIAEGIGQEAMAVSMLALQGNKERARRSPAGIGADTVHR